MSEDPAAAPPLSTAPAESTNWRLIISLALVFFILFALYAAVLNVLLPNQLQNIDPVRKTALLGTLFAITSVFSTLSTPIAGALSDRTRTRFGRRTPWIVSGAVIGGGALISIPHMQGLITITAMWLVACVALNSLQPAITAIIAERFPPERRGFVSGAVGASMTAGLSFGAIFGGLLAAQIGVAYLILGGAIMAVAILFVIVNPEPIVPAAPLPPFRAAEFLRSFWISPRAHPDFAWAFAGRFMIYMGYQGVVTYLLYILQDHIGLSQASANETIARISFVTFLGLVLSGLLSGWISDVTGRRKPLVFAASLVMALALIVPMAAPTTTGMFIYAGLIGLGYGAFMSVDLALMTQVLPVRDDNDSETGKDLGILSTAINIPQIISPVLAAALLDATGKNYNVLFIAGCLFVVAGAFFVLPIRSVR